MEQSQPRDRLCCSLVLEQEPAACSQKVGGDGARRATSTTAWASTRRARTSARGCAPRSRSACARASGRQRSRRPVASGAVECGSVCGEMTDVSPSHAGKLGTSGVPAPKCLACRRPARDAEAQAAALAFVEQLGDSAVGARAHLRGPALRVPFDFVEVPTGVPTVCAFEASPARVTRLPKPNPHSHAA